MKVDLAKAANVNATQGGSARAAWSGGKIEIDHVKMLDIIARAVAAAMGNNLFRGLRTDGRGPMPARKYDGRPRGTGALIAKALAAVKDGALSWVIAAHREKIGHLSRLMAGVPFVAPPIDSIRAAVHSAFLVAVKVSEMQAALPAAMKGRSAEAVAIRAARRAGRERISDRRGELNALVRELGVGAKSRLAGRIRSAGRHAVRARAR